jgi:hypothetical protein
LRSAVPEDFFPIMTSPPKEPIAPPINGASRSVRKSEVDRDIAN